VLALLFDTTGCHLNNNEDVSFADIIKSWRKVADSSLSVTQIPL
jgi:hypothetical protein